MPGNPASRKGTEIEERADIAVQALEPGACARASAFDSGAHPYFRKSKHLREHIALPGVHSARFSVLHDGRRASRSTLLPGLDS